MSATGLRAGVARAWGRIAVAVVASGMVVSGCAASHYQQVSCSGRSRQSIFLLEAQAVPSATLIPCILPLPGGWSYGGSQVRSGLAQFWLDSDRAGTHAAEVRLTRACDLQGRPSSPFDRRRPACAGMRSRPPGNRLPRSATLCSPAGA